MMSREPRRRWLGLLLAFLLPAAIFLLILFRYHILPFGERTLLFSDLDSQYVEFMAEYRRALLGECSLSWSWHAGLGMNFIAIIAYYLASPFNFLLVLFSEAQLPLAVSVITTLKLGCAGAAFARYLSSRAKGNRTLIPMFSACYALGSWALGYAFNIMWLDALIWLPLLCAGIDCLLDGAGPQGMARLVLLFALSFLSQFYMGWMTGAFSALYFLAGLFLRKASFREILRAVLRFAICVGIAAGLSAFLLLPTFFVLKNNMGLMGQSFPDAEGGFPLLRLLKMFFPGSFDWIKDCLPHLYGGLLMLTGVACFSISGNNSIREKAVFWGISMFLLFSLWFKPLDFLWHAMDHPSWFPYRYAFVCIFWGLTHAYAGLSSGSMTLRQQAAACLGPLALLLIAFLCDGAGDREFLLINVLFLAGYGLILLVTESRLQLMLISLLCAAELFMNGSQIIDRFADRYTLLTDYRQFHERYQVLTDPILPRDGDFYRMDKTAVRNYNDPLGIGFPGVSHFSSTASTRQADYLKRLGFNCYATWCTYQGATAASDALLRIRYEFGTVGKQGSRESAAETWEHAAVFPLFFFAEDSFARYDFFSAAEDPLMLQNDLLSLLAGDPEEKFFEEVPVHAEVYSNLALTDGDYLRIDPDQPAYALLTVEPVPGKSLYLYLPEASLNYDVSVGDVLLMSGHSDYASFPICLDGYDDYGSVTVRVETLTDTLTGAFRVYALDVERVTALSVSLNSTAPSAVQTADTEFTLNTDPADAERLIVSSIPFDAGWKVTADGRTLPLKMIHDSLLGFILPAGCETVRIFYEAYGQRMGLILSGCALAMWLGLLIFSLRKRRK